jgi:hypothetical protein
MSSLNVLVGDPVWIPAFAGMTEPFDPYRTEKGSHGNYNDEFAECRTL